MFETVLAALAGLAALAALRIADRARHEASDALTAYDLLHDYAVAVEARVRQLEADLHVHEPGRHR